MAKQTATPQTAADLQDLLNSAGADTDLKDLAQQAISLLNVSEQSVVDLNSKLAAVQDPAGVEAALEEALATVAELSKKLNLQEKTKDLPGVAVTVQTENGPVEKLLIGKSNLKINLKDGKGVKTYTPAEVAASPELLTYLEKINSGTLVDLPASATEGSTSNAAV